MQRIALLIAMLAGCSGSEFAPCTVRCGVGGSCPPDLMCLADNLCHESTGDRLCTQIEDPLVDAAIEACAGDTCSSPPSSCYAARGTCTDNRCVYPFANGASCPGSPPAPTCVGSTLRRSNGAAGTCAAGSCSFGTTDIVCSAGCMDGACLVSSECLLACSGVEPCNGIPDCTTRCAERCGAESTGLTLCVILGGTCAEQTTCLTDLTCLP